MKMTPPQAWAQLNRSMMAIIDGKGRIDQIISKDGLTDEDMKVLEANGKHYDDAISAYRVLALESEAINDITELLAFTFGGAE